MKIAHTLDELNSFSTEPSVLTIGNFDGVHCGHRMVIDHAIESASIRKAKAYAVTFDPHPAHVLHDGHRLALITPLQEKLKLLESTGLDGVIVLPFREIRSFSAQNFAQQILANALHAVEIHEGETFRFGHNAEADIHTLEQLGQNMGFTVHTYDPVYRRGAPISSSRIRTLISLGKLAEARALLGRPFGIHSTPASGRGYGTLYAVPTINLAPYVELVPANGVYITTLRVGTGPDSKLFRGVTNAGNRPTFGADSYAVETHLLDFQPIALTEDTPLELTFLYRLRGEQRFPSPEALKTQIGRDVRHTQRYFALTDALGVPSSQPTASMPVA